MAGRNTCSILKSIRPRNARMRNAMHLPNVHSSIQKRTARRIKTYKNSTLIKDRPLPSNCTCSTCSLTTTQTISQIKNMTCRRHLRTNKVKRLFLSKVLLSTKSIKRVRTYNKLWWKRSSELNQLLLLRQFHWPCRDPIILFSDQLAPWMVPWKWDFNSQAPRQWWLSSRKT